MPSTFTTALSLVITSWLGTSITCSIMLILRPTRSKIGDETEPGLQRVGVLAEALDRPSIALRHELDRPEDEDDGRKKKDENKNGP